MLIIRESAESNMKSAIIGKKIGMTQIFDEAGKVIPVTVIEAGPCVVVQKKTTENDGYEAVQVGFGDMKANRVNKPMKGHFAKGDVAPKRTLKAVSYTHLDVYKRQVCWCVNHHLHCFPGLIAHDPEHV